MKTLLRVRISYIVYMSEQTMKDVSHTTPDEMNAVFKRGVEEEEE